MQKFVDSTNENAKWLSDWKESRYFLQGLSEMSIPRVLEYYIENCVSYAKANKMTIAQLFTDYKYFKSNMTEIYGYISAKYLDFQSPGLQEFLEEAVLDTLLRTKYYYTSDKYALWIERGIVAASGAGAEQTFTVPYIFLRTWLKNAKIYKDWATAIDTIETRATDGKQFEEFYADYRVLFHNALMKKGVETITFDEYFRGAEFNNPELKSKKLLLNKRMCAKRRTSKTNMKNDDGKNIDSKEISLLKMRVATDTSGDLEVRLEMNPYGVLVESDQAKVRNFTSSAQETKRITADLLVEEYVKAFNACAPLAEHEMFMLFLVSNRTVSLGDTRANGKELSTQLTLENNSKLDKAPEKVTVKSKINEINQLFSQVELKLASTKHKEANIALVYKNNFVEYFGEFAGRANWLHTSDKTLYPNYDKRSDIVAITNDTILADKILEERNCQAFTSITDFDARVLTQLKSQSGNNSKRTLLLTNYRFVLSSDDSTSLTT